MTSSCLWVVIVLFTIILEGSHVINGYNKNEELKQQKMVEVLQLMVSQGSKNKGNFEIQKVPENDDYEILITPNEKQPEFKGSQNFKIYIEAENYEGNRKNFKPKGRDKQNGFDVLPLSIESEGSKLEIFQQPSPATPKYGSEYEEYTPKDFESNHNKRQTNCKTQRSRTLGRSDLKILNCPPSVIETVIIREPNFGGQHNPFLVTTPVKDERQTQLTYNGDYSSSNQNGKRVVQQSYGDEYIEQIDDSRRENVKKTYQNSYNGAGYEEIRPSNERRPGVKEDVDQRRPVNRPEIMQTKPTYVKGNDEYRPTDSRPLNYNTENSNKRPNYDTETRPSSNNRPVYSREPEKPKLSNERYPEYESQYEEERPTRQPVHSQRPENSRPNKNERPTYEKENTSDSGYDDSEVDASYRPVREDNNSYSGFPESNQQNINNHYSRPLQYEPVRAFPASPCLNVFKYEGREPGEDRWYADIFVTTNEVLNGMRLDITLDRPAELLTNWLSEVKTKDSIHFTILSLTQKLVPGPAETVRIMVKFNGKKPIPFLKSINLNGRLICPSSRSQKTTTKKPQYENVADLHIKHTTEKYPSGQKSPLSFVEDYESTTKKTTTHVERRTTPPYEENRKPPSQTPLQHKPNPNPNGYDETDLNSFSSSTKKPLGRPSHSNGKPPPHASKPAQGNKPGHGHGHGQGHGNRGSGSKNPSTSSQTPTSQNNRPLPTITNQQDSHRPLECGTPSIQPSPLITHGQLTSRGQWPWHAALYKNVGTDLSFFCGGTLIDTKHVLTAAHCVTKTYTTRPLDENSVVVYLGKYHLKLWSEGGVQNRQVSKIYIHPKYNSSDFRSDIAVLELSAPVEYTDYVRPICLWDRSNTRIEDVEGKLGTVVGWGFDETKKLTEELRQAKMPVVEQKTCLWSYPDFYPQFTSNMTYCAGFKNGTSVCNGDSGGGMVFPYKDRWGEERWHLRGIVSISPARNDSRVCDTSHYVVFTDVAKYLPWLDNFV